MQELQKREMLQATLLELDSIVFKGYLDNLGSQDVIPLGTSVGDGVAKIRLNKIARIVYDKNENNFDKFNNVFSAMHNCDSSLVIVIKSSVVHTDLYIGTNKTNSSAGFSGAEADQTLKAALAGNFPGLEFSDPPLYKDDIECLANSINSDSQNYIASVIGVPSLKSDDKNEFVQGLEKIIDGMRGREYTAVIQATPVSRPELESIEMAYQDIYTALSVFEQTQITMTENESITLGESLTDGLTKTISTSLAKTQTETNGTSSSASASKSKTRSDWDIKKALSGAAAGAASGAVGAASVSGGMGAPAGAAVGAIIGFGAGLLGGSKSTSETSTLASSQSDTRGLTETEGRSESENQSRTDSRNLTSGNSKSLLITAKNRRVQFLLEAIDEQLVRIKECKSYGMWSWGAYFVGKQELDVKLGADVYLGLLHGELTGLEKSAVTTWKREGSYDNKFNNILNYIAQLRHPIFKTPDYYRAMTISSVSLVSTKEVSVAMGLPQKSLPGIPVMESVEFGRAVTTYNNLKGQEKVNVGNIFNLGSIDKNLQVNLNKESLSSHVFITGSTGSGKSNTIYCLLNSLTVPFLVIEPAKGEYSKVFGGMKDVSVFGTNPYFTHLLRINPFSFPAKIHVIEHIDRFIEILNAVWPMYAAMPAILKEAVEITYQNMGWDLLTSKNRYGEVYPDFYDLLEVLPEVVSRSQYSDEIKSNYIGALVTRIKSLTNGYFHTIFRKEELDMETLFDKKCILDFSRVGSSETKSLLMGIVFLKLQEYRMANASDTNSALKHVTVIEEAHNLLRRTSCEQSQEGANLQGKSVEMISNAIAEMRTYGEGFIIADQAPGLLDPSVIRNTNTKIIHRLPDWDDRMLVGKAANLKDDQIEELARLRTGCAAIYQNDWQEAVLCQVGEFDGNLVKPYIFESLTKCSEEIRFSPRCYHRTKLVEYFLKDEVADNPEQRPEWLMGAKLYFPRFAKFVEGGGDNKSEYLLDLIQFSELLGRLPKTVSHKLWLKELFKLVFCQCEPDLLSKETRHLLICAILDNLEVIDPEQKKLWAMEKTNSVLWTKEFL